MTAPPSKDREKQLVTFRLGPEEYGIEIGSVQEIIKLPGITKVPKSPHYLEGVVNLRGHILPIIDTRKRLDMGEAERESTSRIVVTNLEDTSVGLVVDAVSEVIRVESSLIEPPPPALSFSATEHINGICKLNGGNRLVSMLNLPNITRIDSGAEDLDESSDYPAEADGDQNAGAGGIVEELQLVSFALGSEEYAVDINRVEEIIKIPKITGIPDAPGHVEGVICLRGAVMPVISLRSRFGMEKKPADKRSRILVIRFHNGEKKILFGVVVDMVNEVISLSMEKIEPAPDAISDGSGHIFGIGKLNGGGRLVMLLDPEKLMNIMNMAGGHQNEDNMQNQGTGSEVRSPLDIRQMVSLKIGKEDFGIDIMNVREIIRLSSITGVPGSPHYVKGVVNLRGDVLPVIDLRSRFGMEWKEPSDSDRIVVVTCRDKATGLIVDSVSEVFQMPVKDIEPTPDLMSEIDASFIQGIGKLSGGKRFIIILDIPRILNIREPEAELLSDLEADLKTIEFKTVPAENEFKVQKMEYVYEDESAMSAGNADLASEAEQMAALQEELMARMDLEDEAEEADVSGKDQLSEAEQMAALQEELLARMDDDEEEEEDETAVSLNKTRELSEEEQLRLLQEQLLAQMGPEDDEEEMNEEAGDAEESPEETEEPPVEEEPVEKKPSRTKKKNQGKGR